MINIDILSLDLSTKSTGWGVFINNEFIESGVITASSPNVITRIEKITKAINTILNKYNKIDIVICEEVLPTIGHNSNTNVLKALMWLQAAVAFLIYDDFPNIKQEFLMPNAWRSIIGIKTGKNQTRKQLKQESLNYVKDFFNKEKITDDEADAICLGCSYLKTKYNIVNWE